MTDNEDQKKKIEELEEKVKRLEEALNEKKKEEKEDAKNDRGVEGDVGIAEDVIGDIFPGLGKLVRGLRKSEEFGRRLDEVDRELKENLKRGGRRTSVGRRPHIETDFSIRTLGEAREFRKSSFGDSAGDQKRRRTQKAGVKNVKIDEEKLKGREPLIDVIDEEKEITIIAEMPGVEEGEIKTVIGGEKGTKLIISTEGEGEDKRKYYKEVDLPSPVKREMKIAYKHGVLALKLEKEIDEKKEGEKVED